MQIGQNILGDAANECAISVDPTNGNKMTIAWRQFNDVTSNFRQGGWGYTTDAGVHWTFPGVLQNNVFRSDPVTQSDETGQFFYLSLQSHVANSRFSVTICGARPTAVKPGRSSRPTEARAAIRHGLRSIRLTDRGTGSNTRSYDSANCAGTSAAFQRSTNGGSHLAEALSIIPNCAHIRDPRCGYQRQRFCWWLDWRHRISLRALEQRTDRGPDTLF